MKKTFLILVLLAAMNVNAQWVQMSNGIGVDRNITSFAILGSNIYTGLFTYGVYMSTNNGSNWTQTSLNNRNVNSLTVSGNNIFAGTDSYGVYISTNNGTSWTQTALNNQTVLSLITNANIIFAGTNSNGIYLSTNNGTNWTQTSLNNQTVRVLTNNVNNIYAGTNGNGVYLSTNNGSSWTLTAMTGVMVYSLATLGNNVFEGMGTGAYISTNDGALWTQTSLNNFGVRSLLGYGYIYAGTYNGGVYLSKNNGTTWVAKNQGFSVLPSVSALFTANSYIFAGTFGNSIWRRSISEIISIQNINTEIPAEYSLSQNYPNPFNPKTNLKFQIVNLGDVKIVVFDITGKEVQTLVNERLKPGSYEVSFDGSMLNSGVYFYKLITDHFTKTNKMLFIK